MKKTLLILLILSFQCSAQVILPKRVIGAISPLINGRDSIFSERLHYEYNGEIYRGDELIPLADLVAFNFLTERMNEIKGFDDLEMTEYKKIITAMARLKFYDRITSHSLDSLRKCIQKLTDPTEKINAEFYFTINFSNRFQTNIDELKNTVSNIAFKQKDVRRRAECLIDIANSSLDFLDVPYTLYFYLHALEIYDSLGDYGQMAATESQIALMYENKDDDFFLRDAIVHYQNAAAYCYKTYDTIGEYLCQLWCERLKNKLHLSSNLLAPFQSLWPVLNNDGLSPYVSASCYAIMGKYFEEAGSYQTALRFLSAAVIKDVDADDMKNLYADELSVLNIIAKKKDALLTAKDVFMVHMLDSFMLYQIDEYETSNYLLGKAQLYFNMKNSDYAVAIVKRIFEQDKFHLTTGKNIDLTLRAAEQLKTFYLQLDKGDSAHMYYGLADEARANFIDEIDRTRKLEADYSSTLYNKFIDKQQSKVTFLSDSLATVNTLVREKINMLHNLEQRVSKDSTKVLSLRQQKMELQNDLKYLKKTIHNTNTYGGITILVLVALGILAIYYYNIKLVEKNREKKLEAERLTYQARAKIHNLGSKYDRLYNIALREISGYKNDVYESPLIYVIEKNTTYLGELLNSWKKSNWTINDEIALLEAFYKSEIGKIPEDIGRKHVQLVYDIPKELKAAQFLQDVFTTLLDNSMRYAFPKKGGQIFFYYCYQTKRKYFDVKSK